MKDYQEIRRIVVDEFGFRDLLTYQHWVATERAKIRPTPEGIAKLSPDLIDCRAFWRVADELFGCDPVCNIAMAPEVGRLPFAVETQMDANRHNLRLAKSLGITAFLEENASARLKVFEIGTGYGSLKSYIETNTNHCYTGVDVVPRVPNVLETTEDGLIPRDLVTRERSKFSYVLSTNVFQHMSQRQRVQYIDDAHSLLHEGGLLIVNLTVDTGRIPPEARDADGNAWAFHYGQFTPIPKGPAAYDLMNARFTILYVTQRYDGLMHFVCQRNESSHPSVS
jgi:hypothetical protein